MRKRLQTFLILAFIFFFSTLSYAQRGNAVLILKDSAKIHGVGGIYTNRLIQSITFGNDTLKQKFYNSGEVIGIDVLEKNYYRKFRYKFKDGKRYPEILEVLSIDSLSLYIRMYVETFAGNNTNNEDIFNPPTTAPVIAEMLTDEKKYDIFNNTGNPRYSYYVGNATSDQVEHLYSKGPLFAKSFKKAMIAYFSDCTQLIDKVENKEFSIDEVWKVIDFYNQECIQGSAE